ncbi:54S ribosomal protein L4 mitochondrial [Phlyctochytrium bullatum]|nr:54S ribosomal protein L4 mitochondrial [Phlyctochytrium bullatum]
MQASIVERVLLRHLAVGAEPILPKTPRHAASIAPIRRLTSLSAPAAAFPSSRPQTPASSAPSVPHFTAFRPALHTRGSSRRWNATSVADAQEAPESQAVQGTGRGLLDFFDTEKGWIWRPEEKPTGRAWTCAELRGKSFQDLHSLWWICIKEVNLLESQKVEARRFKRDFPHDTRLKTVRKTMRNIKLVLWERRIAYLQAQAVVKLEVARRNLYLEEFEKVREAQAAEKATNVAAAAPAETVASSEPPATEAQTNQNAESAPADASEAKAAQEGAAEHPDTLQWIAITPEMRKRVRGKLQEMFPTPLELVGRRPVKLENWKRREEEISSGRKRKGIGFGRAKSKKSYGRRWYIL